MKYIAQKSDWDCGVAALAMAVEESYDTILNDICGPSGFPLNELYVYDWCLKNGWAWQLMYVNRPRHESEKPEGEYSSGYCRRDPWPPKPFAPSHICMVEATRGWHFCAMDGAGARV